MKDIKKSNLDTKFGYQPTKSILTTQSPPNKGSNVQPAISIVNIILQTQNH